MTALDELSIRMWEEPLHSRIRRREGLDGPSLVVVTIEALRTEIEMGGVLSFLENQPAGFTLADAIHACDAIGARPSGDILRAVERLMVEHGVTSEALRADVQNAEAGQITTSSQIHECTVTDAFLDAVEAAGTVLDDAFFTRRAAYSRKHDRPIRALLARE